MAMRYYDEYWSKHRKSLPPLKQPSPIPMAAHIGDFCYFPKEESGDAPDPRPGTGFREGKLWLPLPLTGLIDMLTNHY